MKILHLIYDHINNPWVGGGGAVRVYELYRRLAERHHIAVVCGKYPGAEDYREGNLGFHFVGTSKNNYVLSTFCYAVRAAQYLSKGQGSRVKGHNSELQTLNSKLYDIVIEDFAPYNPLFSKFIVDKPLILQIHHKEGINLFKRYFILGCPFMLIETFYPRLFNNIICVSEGSRRKFNVANATIIPNGIDNKLFEVVPSQGDYIGYVGRLHIHNKGLDTAVKAMKIIEGSNKGQMPKLIIAGKGRDELRLQSLVRRFGLSGKVELIGHLNGAKKIEFLANSKIVIIPSRYEGQGIVVLEAAACGKPVIVSNIPELRYAVDAGFGLAFKTGDAIDLAEKMKLLLEDESLRREMGKRAREYAKNYTWDRIAEDYERFLTKVMEES